MVNYTPFHNALNGLSKKYEREFKRVVSPVLTMDKPFELSYDEVDKQNRSDSYRYLRDNFDRFQDPYSVAAFELGKSIYSANRDLAESKSNKPFPAFPGVSLTRSLINDNAIPFWEVSGLLEKIYNGSSTLDFVSQIGSTGMVDLSRSSTMAAGIADVKMRKKPFIANQAGACDFCRNTADAINATRYGHSYNSVKFHRNCKCSLIFEYILD